MIEAKTPEELALLIEPFPFISDEDKKTLVEASRVFFEFLQYLEKKYNARFEVVKTRLDMMVAKKMAEKLVKRDSAVLAIDDTDDDETFIKKLFGIILDDIAKEEGFDGSLRASAETIMGLEESIKKYVTKLVEDGREAELNSFLEMMKGME